MKSLQVRERVPAQQRILDAACEEFVEKGLSGARMQAIARRARVNKALIHYYFRSKQRLYESVFENVLNRIWMAMEKNMAGLDENADIAVIVRILVATYINTLKDSPEFPRIFMRELADGGQNLRTVVEGFIQRFGHLVERIFAVMKKSVQQRALLPIDPIHIMINIMGMCAASFILKPVVAHIQTSIARSPIQFDEKFYAARIIAITEMALNGIVVHRRQ